MSRQIICVEVTKTNVSYDLSQAISLIIYRDSQDNYCLSLEQLKQIKSKIVEVVRLGSNYRHPLLFDVQVVPGNGSDALIGSVQNPKTKLRKRRNN